MTPARHYPMIVAGRAWRGAFTLAELIISLSIMSVLMAAMTSVVVLATHALPDGNSPLETSVRAADAIDGVAEDLVYATTVTEATATAITVTVADRNHGAAGPETIRIAWSGTPGDPLTRQYNGGTVMTLCANVQSFSLAYATQPGSPPTTHNLLFVTNNTVSPPHSDLAKIAKIQSWGYTVQTIADSDTVATFDTAIKTSDVIYISRSVSAVTLGSKPIARPIGVVTEERATGSALGISSAGGSRKATAINIINNTHMITSELSLGTLTICTSKQLLTCSNGTLASGALVLAELNTQPSLIAMEIGAARYDSGTATGRRVMLPWGRDALVHYEFASLNETALKIMRRSLAWASVPAVYSNVHIKLQIGSVPATEAETNARLLNLPEAS